MKKNLLFKFAALSFLISPFLIQQALEAAEVYGQLWIRSISSGRTSSYPRAMVEVRSQEGVLIKSATSNSRGKYYIFNVPPGNYNVLVDGEARETVNVPSSNSQPVEVDDIVVRF